MWSRSKLKNTEYQNSSTYRKYAKLIGKIVIHKVFVGTERDANGQFIRDEAGLIKNKYEDRLFLISGVYPHEWYVNRFAYKLSAIGSHMDEKEMAVNLFRDLKSVDEKHLYGYRFYNDEQPEIGEGKKQNG
jgi:hypothetical protein